ncbi:NAD(P)-dependent oxidoreductase [Caballeronia zhejiangensis]|uniref:Pyridine nucleotide transhydrogenase n=1 Tax=Caballeronia zhejiangensis TaxID=871203 RepID=A0A656QLQ0_9BURK|nr:NAD(P)-dependent oxidoreductase [Caballeronia zhejiangensis]KDR31429.1 pyridine nucleotide transhydrogenase [Caballeronia zhejiangensis]
MTNALIGFSGFVGQTLLKQRTFDSLYRSTNIDAIDGQRFDDVVCAAAPAQKWIANRDPKCDLRNIEALIAHLMTIKCGHFTLISTVDVFKAPAGVDEDTLVDETDLHAYGKNRRHLEKFVEAHFSQHLIVRLPGLVGPGLRKNVIFDFLNDNNVGMIDSRGVFQFYPMVNLAYDISIARDAGLKLVHLTAEPISVADVSKEGFGKPFEQALGNAPVTYDLRTKHSAVFGAAGPWQYSRRETVQALRAYAQSEPLTSKARA